ncbi:1-acyl-sn-glycerol-3-phosphate acyltransferase [Sphingobium subterraneum]|uniref:1-acyl-sn-glycerol-3-phosphate acyltransferase n=1 Tax=Sphingobium subterraneum TaxID=627688 RepID=A0A841J4P2_9SPHN|nr:1-acyl-sn-glycerol-3-phosphate acyltransferase [Sphingobium subterraneum]
MLHLHSPWPQRFLGLAARSVGARVTRSGRPVLHDVFYISNHVSWIDILAMGGATGCAFVSKDDVGRWPIVGWLAAQNNTILIDRSNRASVGQQIETVRAAIAAHQPIALFPEGTTGNGHELLPFKPTLLAVLFPPPRAIRIQPVFIDYGEATDDIAWHGQEGAGSNAKRILERPGTAPVTLHFLEPFDPGDHPDRKAIAAEVRNRIEAALAASVRAPRPV